MRSLNSLYILMLPTLLIACEPESKPQPLLTIKLGGNGCMMYQGALTSALMNVEGVEGVDVISNPGHVQVRGNPQRMKSREVLDAINGLQGDNWSCQGSLLP